MTRASEYYPLGIRFDTATNLFDGVDQNVRFAGCGVASSGSAMAYSAGVPIFGQHTPSLALLAANTSRTPHVSVEISGAISGYDRAFDCDLRILQH
jgi:hypothetical protein